jgi:predicted dithiol-disulfide oxidoreductase (DUF899 family)
MTGTPLQKRLARQMSKSRAEGFVRASKIEPFKKRMGWTVPWFSSFGSDFNYDFGVTTGQGETFGLSVFSVMATTPIIPTLPPDAALNTSVATSAIST